MRNAGLILVLFFFIGATASCGEKGASKGNEEVNGKMWLSFNEGMAVAAKEKKQTVIDFYTSWCRWCKVMDKETFRNRDVESYLAENFVTIRVDAENRTETLSYQGDELTPASLASRFGVRGYPSLAYLNTEGTLIMVVPGYMPAKTFLPMLQYMHKECYKQRISFEEFMKRKGECDTTRTL